jgi:molybdopterin converting factor small subunit
MDDASFLSNRGGGCMERYQQLRSELMAKYQQLHDEQKAVNDAVQQRLNELEAALAGGKETVTTAGESVVTARIPALEVSWAPHS